MSALAQPKCAVCRKPVTPVTGRRVLGAIFVHEACGTKATAVAKRSARVGARALGIYVERRYPDLFQSARELYAITRLAREE